MSEKNDKRAGIVISGKKYTFKNILLAVLILIVLTFIALNWQSVEIHLIFANLHVRLAILIFMTFGLGFFAGWLTQVLRKKNKEKPTAQVIDVEPKAIREAEEEEDEK